MLTEALANGPSATNGAGLLYVLGLVAFAIRLAVIGGRK